MSTNQNDPVAQGFFEQASDSRRVAQNTQSRLNDRDKQLRAAQETIVQLSHKTGIQDSEIARLKEQIRSTEELELEVTRLRRINGALTVRMKMNGSWNDGRNPNPPNFEP